MTRKQKRGRCLWCGKNNRTMSDWEQQRLHSREYAPLCVCCANRRLDNPYNALLLMRKRKAEGGMS